MNKGKIENILKEAFRQIKPSDEELFAMNNSVNKILGIIKLRIKKSRLDAEIFVGGSFAKKTIIKKDKYDVDVFLRFGQKYAEKDISEITGNLLENFRGVTKIHGSRDYYKIKADKDIEIELIPVRKIKNSEKAENITDLSYSHVNYIKKKITPKLGEQIMLAKAFCHANNCYGAESYIQGFSGYGLELLVYYYGNFIKFINEIAKSKPEQKIIIDIERDYSNKSRILMDINASKLHSPIVLIDPTFKERNVLAALSSGTFKRFWEACVKFVKNPSLRNFERRRMDIEEARKKARKNKIELATVEIKTSKQEGDIAGSKLLKFFNHICGEAGREFELRMRDFEYDDKQTAVFYIGGRAKKEKILIGPFISDKKNSKAFKKAHKKTFIKNKRLYCRERINLGIKAFLSSWSRDNKKKISDMSITSVKII